MYLFIFAVLIQVLIKEGKGKLAIGLGRRWVKHVVEDRLVLLRP